MKKALKRSISWLLAITIIFSSAYVGLSEVDFDSLLTVKAQAASVDDLTFVLNDDGKSYSVTDCDESATGELVIPNVYNSLPVTYIGDSAFSGCVTLTAITIPDSVISIGSSAFYNCTGLEKIYWNAKSVSDFTSSSRAFYNAGTSSLGIDIVFGDTVERIPAYLFYVSSSSYRPKVTSVTISNSVTSIGDSAFSGCAGLTSITIPVSVTRIGSSAFSGCTGLEKIYWNAKRVFNFTNYSGVFNYAGILGSGIEVVFGDTVERIPAYLFYVSSSSYTPKVTSVTISNSVTSIGDSAFYGCAGLDSITISDSVTRIGSDAFYGTGYYNDDTNWGNNVLYIGNHLIKAKTSISSDYVIKEGTKTIADDAFWYCTNLTSITTPDSVTTIGSAAFYGCTGLTSINIPDSITSIGESVFGGCKGLTSIIIPDGVTSIGIYAFQNCISLTSIIIPDSVTSIGSGAFLECTSLISITIPDCVTTIGDYAFFNCLSLTSINIPDSATNIGKSAFYGCAGLTSIIIPNNITSMGDYAFCGCTSLTSIDIPDTVTSIGKCAFGDCTSLISINIPGSVTNISDYAFCGCTSLASVIIGNGVTSIGDSVFEDCTSLTSINIPDSVTNISDYAFNECIGLTNVYYGGAEADWENITIGSYNSCLTNATIHFHEHSYSSDWIVDVEPTCTKAGSKHNICSDCGKVVIKEIPIQKNIIWITEKEPTCTVAGYKDCYCLDCGELIGTEEIPATGHPNKTWITEKAPTCTVAGYKNCYCLDCGEMIGTEEISVIAHSYGDWIIDTAPTCTEEGAKHQTCSACGDIVAGTIEPNGHNHSTEWITDIEPTCTEEGSKSHHCTVCGDKANITSVQATGHSYGDWIVDLASTCTEKGAKHQTCSSCGDIVTGTIEPNGHNHSTEWTIDTKPMCIEEGSKSHHCTVCGDKADITAIKALGHDYTVVSTEAEHPHLSVFKCTRCSVDKQEGIYSPTCIACNFSYDIVDDETCKVTGYIGTGSIIKLPGFIDERVVATTTTGAFKNNTTVTSVIIEDGVQSIGALSFLGCTSLSKIVIPASVTSIGASAFHNCASNFMIYCYRDTYAMQYAIDNSLKYVIMDIGETENCTIDYSNNLIFSSKDGVTNLLDIIYTPATSTVSVQASLVSGDKEFLGTGSKIIVVDNGVSSEYTLIVNGDTNSDSVCDALDAAQVALVSNGQKTIDGAYKMAADSNRDDVVDIEDYQAVVNKLVS